VRQFPEDKDDEKDLKKLNAEPWMVEALKLNPEYVHWGPHEDYMCKRGDGWESPIIKKTWKDFDIKLDDLNEVVHFYFGINRANKKCETCGGCGYHPDAQWVEKSWYRHCSPFTFPTQQERLISQGMHESFGSPLPVELHGRGAFPSEETLGKYKPEFRAFCEAMRDGDGFWSDKLVQEEVEALVKDGRLMDWTHHFESGKGWKEKAGGAVAHMPSAAEVNAAQHKKGLTGHDAINQMIAVRARCERYGLPVTCPECEGSGHVFTAPKATLGVVFWLLHPRKGAARGVEVEEVEKKDFKKVLAFLAQAAKRSVERFQKAVAASEE
jgi:hypothetical protein